MNTANLHARRYTKTAKQMAAEAGVSVRMIFDAMKLHATDRDDLKEKVRDGSMSLHRALIEAGLKQRPGNKATALFTAWNRASDSERQAFVDWLQANADTARPGR